MQILVTGNDKHLKMFMKVLYFKNTIKTDDIDLMSGLHACF